MKTLALVASVAAGCAAVVACVTQRSVNETASESMSLNNAGFAYMQTLDNMNAKAYLEKAITVAPDLAVAHLNLGVVYQKIGYLSEAEEQYRLAISNDAGYNSEGAIVAAEADFNLLTVGGIAHRKIAELP